MNRCPTTQRVSSETGVTPAIITVGPAVIDSIIRPASPASIGDKQDCHLAMKLGGGAANVAREILRQQQAVRPVLLVGDDDGRTLVSRLARREFGDSATIAPLMESTRRSIVVGRQCFTVRSQVQSSPQLEGLLRTIAKSSWTVIAPHTAADGPFVNELLRFAPRSVLQMSTGQLADRAMAVSLARQATVVVVNQAELELWSGLADSQAGIERLLEQGIRNVIVTSDYRVLGRLHNVWLSLDVPRVANARQTSGAGDTFVGALVANLADGAVARVAVSNAIQAASTFVAAHNRHDSSSEQPVPRPHLLQRLRLQAAGLASLASTSLLGWFGRA